MFSINKLIEYSLKFDAGITPVTNPFFSFYFFITIVHFLHVLAGMIFLFAFRKDANACTSSDKYVIGLENVGLFWHYVTVLWIFIFPLLVVDNEALDQGGGRGSVVADAGLPAGER